MCIRDRLKGSPLNSVYVLGESADLLEKVISERLPGHEVIMGDANSLISQMEADGNAGYFLANYTMPVSYTHLDVYKRQPIISPTPGTRRSQAATVLLSSLSLI